MFTIRHDDTLYWKNKLVMAPRKFELEGSTYYVHIYDECCSKVLLFLKIKEVSYITYVVVYTIYKLYDTSKGSYFNFKGKRIYLCD